MERNTQKTLFFSSKWHLAGGAARSANWYSLSCGGRHTSRTLTLAGFCVFNDLAYASRALIKLKLAKVLIFDCDVHQGDGTARILAKDKNIFTCRSIVRLTIRRTKPKVISTLQFQETLAMNNLTLLRECLSKIDGANLFLTKIYDGG